MCTEMSDSQVLVSAYWQGEISLLGLFGCASYMGSITQNEEAYRECFNVHDDDELFCKNAAMETNENNRNYIQVLANAILNENPEKPIIEVFEQLEKTHPNLFV